ncbi:MAG: hypothetical protein NTW19_02070 [Planctomycetota bacterium]|nr:hypothetical protein [Planctomycetota bacterium]
MAPALQGGGGKSDPPVSKPPEADAPKPKPDPKKAYAWFERGKTMADANQHDYAIECYINGLAIDPDNIIQHEALLEVAKRRKVSGGKPATMMEKIKGGGRDPIDRFLQAERLWAKEPLNKALMIAAMERAVEVDQVRDDLHMGEVANWIGELLLDQNQYDKAMTKADLVKLRDLFQAIMVYPKAIDACRRALSMDRLNPELNAALKNLEAEKTLHDGNFNQMGDKDKNKGGFRDFVKDQSKQTELERQDRSSTRTESDTDALIETRRTELEADPSDPIRLSKLATVLAEKETDETQEEAIKLYKQLFAKTEQHVYKSEAGRVRIKMLGRHARNARREADLKPNDAKAAQAYQDKYRALRQFELDEFTERVKAYPSDMDARFRMGELLYIFKKYEEAIAAFQTTRLAPKYRPQSCEYLGRCFLTQGWADEAIQALRDGIESYNRSDDKLGLDLRFRLMAALEASARKNRDLEMAREAVKWGSQVLQANINHRDIKARMEALRKLITQLQSKDGGALEGPATPAAGDDD